MISRKINRAYAFIVILMVCQSFYAQNSLTSINDVIELGLKRTEQQTLLMAEKLIDMHDRLPKSVDKDNKLTTSDYKWWCSGFFPGQIWYVYKNNPSDKLNKYAKIYTERVERARFFKANHDVGFMINCSFGNQYKFINDKTVESVLIDAANSLCTRFSPTVGLIRSWDFNKHKWQYPVIIDNMMNLELLMDVYKITGEKKYKKIAMSHADKTMQNHFRNDYSCYHVVSYDTITGKPHIKQTHQGYSDESSWSRGQAWALYGYTMMYKECKEKRYLKHAQNVAKFIMNNPTMLKDKVPYWDFNAPDIPNAPRDASAAAVMASAFIDLSTLTSGKESAAYLSYADEQLRSLTTDKYLAKEGENNYFVLKHSTGSYPMKSEVDVPLSYADYYYAEALVRFKNLLDKR